MQLNIRTREVQRASLVPLNTISALCNQFNLLIHIPFESHIHTVYGILLIFMAHCANFNNIYHILT